MPSPFPGMDPWLESTRDFGNLHFNLIYNLQATLQPLLPASYYARTSVRIWLGSERRHIEPDIDLVKDHDQPPPTEFPAVATLAETGATIVLRTGR